MNAAVDLRARVLYRDSQVIVIDKPSCLPVHAGPRQKASTRRRLKQLGGALRSIRRVNQQKPRRRSGTRSVGGEDARSNGRDMNPRRAETGPGATKSHCGGPGRHRRRYQKTDLAWR